MSPLWGFRGVSGLIFYKHIGPLGLWRHINTPIHIALRPDAAIGIQSMLGLGVGQDAQPTGVVCFDTHIAVIEALGGNLN